MNVILHSKLSLRDREWICINCSAHHDRDVNAAINVLRYSPADWNLVKRTGRVKLTKDTRRTVKAKVS